MKLQYLVNNVLKETSLSNQELEIHATNSENRTLISIKALEDIVLVSASDGFDYKIDPNDTFFTNGYQSWTTTYESDIRKKEKKILRVFNLFKFLVLKPYGDYEWYETKKDRLHSYDFYYVKGNNEIFILNNNFKKAFLIIETLKNENVINLYSDVEGKVLKKGQEFVLYDYEIYSSYEKGMAEFNSKYPHKNLNKIFGYTSWYNYYQNINEKIILRDLAALDDRFDLFQIDDGYETYVGDWLDVDKEKFPNGLTGIVEKIHSKGFKAGLWLAPFLAEKESKLVKEHPEYLKCDANGNPVMAGVNWSGPYILDLQKTEVKEYIQKCLKHYADMGFDFFKLDFIYASAYTHTDVTRAEASEESYKFLKECLPGKTILGCGATLGNVYNNFDYVRVGPDVSLDFDDKLYMRLLHRERPSTKNTVLNTIYRSFMNDRLFGNDPDVFLLRDQNLTLTKKQRYALAKLNALFGSVLMTSDDIATYDDEKKEILNKVLNVYRHAKDVKFETIGTKLHVSYKLDGEQLEFDYDTKKGIIENER